MEKIAQVLLPLLDFVENATLAIRVKKGVVTPANVGKGACSASRRKNATITGTQFQIKSNIGNVALEVH